LIKEKAFQKLNRVLSKALQLHSDCLDLWLLAVYTEFDLKGNLFSSRNIMLQALRTNKYAADYFFEYFKYELAFLKKMKQRKLILQEVEKDEKNLKFDSDLEDEKEFR